MSGIGGNGGPDDNAAQGGHLVAYQQQGTNVGAMGAMRRGNGNVTGGVPFLATTITAREAKGPDPDATSGNLVTHALTAEGHDASEDGTGRGTPLVPVTVPTLTASMGSNNAAPGNGGKDEMVVPVAYALRADPGGVGQGHNTNYVPVDLAQVTSGENRSNPQPGDPAATLAATSRPAVAFGHTNGIDVRPSETVAPTMRAGHGVGGGGDATAAAVRRLTPVECERLQGYPDGWTEKAVRLERDGNRWLPVGETVQADSPRYRELGNSIAVPVFVWVAERIVRANRGERP